MQSVAAQRPFFFDHMQELADQAFMEFYGADRASLRPR
jgi:pyruvate-ferredoxin/flavodoxin oxidoreductase